MVYSLLLCCLPVRSLGASLVLAPDFARTAWILVGLDMRAQYYGGPCLRSERRGLAAPGPHTEAAVMSPWPHVAGLRAHDCGSSLAIFAATSSWRGGKGSCRRPDSDGLDPRMEPMPCSDPQTFREVGLSTLRGRCFADSQIVIYSSANPHNSFLGIVFQIEERGSTWTPEGVVDLCTVTVWVTWSPWLRMSCKKGHAIRRTLASD